MDNWSGFVEKELNAQNSLNDMALGGQEKKKEEEGFDRYELHMEKLFEQFSSDKKKFDLSNAVPNVDDDDEEEMDYDAMVDGRMNGDNEEEKHDSPTRVSPTKDHLNESPDSQSSIDTAGSHEEPKFDEEIQDQETEFTDNAYWGDNTSTFGGYNINDLLQ